MKSESFEGGDASETDGAAAFDWYDSKRESVTWRTGRKKLTREKKLSQYGMILSMKIAAAEKYSEAWNLDDIRLCVYCPSWLTKESIDSKYCLAFMSGESKQMPWETKQLFANGKIASKSGK